ncbi:LacI family DNA-binding transcriptional regulator [Rhodovibrio salinarum]|uniref:LacI family transcriptional regulator n=1 Tax=Rhodovibrio salinarum TaxID=1087 RepID=A0A934QIA9_9PROT|nr:LacI family DNA-binding transcriptional regulator [Rhodovibrio salinarum]MBK1697217.1 LacI family transcriptional regulator [Rhodovibrio salinarum]
MPSSRVTITDIARYVGVSPSTVSLVLRRKGAISEATKEAVHRAIDELGYVYDRNAANLRSRTTQAIGLLINDVRNPFFAELATAVQEASEEDDYLTHLLSSSENVARQSRYIRSLLEMRVAGVIVCAATGTDREALSPLLEREIPTVLAVRPLDVEGVAFVGPDNRKAGELVARHLLDLGHSDLAFIGGEPGNPARDARFGGFAAALEERGVGLNPDWVIDIRPTVTAGAIAIERLLERSPRPTAIVCYNDLLAFSASERLWAEGIAVGEDVALTGFDDLPLSRVAVPPLTTVDLKVHEIGRRASELLLDKLEHPGSEPQQVFLEPDLVVRRTCGSGCSPQNRPTQISEGEA